MYRPLIISVSCGSFCWNISSWVTLLNGTFVKFIEVCVRTWRFLPSLPNVHLLHFCYSFWSRFTELCVCFLGYTFNNGVGFLFVESVFDFIESVGVGRWGVEVVDCLRHRIFLPVRVEKVCVLWRSKGQCVLPTYVTCWDVLITYLLSQLSEERYPSVFRNINARHIWENIRCLEYL